MEGPQIPTPQYVTSSGVCSLVKPPMSKVKLWRLRQIPGFPKPFYLPSSTKKKDGEQKGTGRGFPMWDLSEVLEYFEKMKSQREAA